MAYTVTSALMGSLLFSLTLVPLLCFYLLRESGCLTEKNLIVRASKARVCAGAQLGAVE